MILLNIYLIVGVVITIAFLSLLMVIFSKTCQEMALLINLDKYVNNKCKNIVTFAKNMDLIVKRLNKENNYELNYLEKGNSYVSYADMAYDASNGFDCKSITLNQLMYKYFIDDIDNLISDILEVHGEDRDTFKHHVCLSNNLSTNEKENSYKSLQGNSIL